jgi:hypothetical protein|tara:strand:+ start:48 stop:554 length:507 start_codon:yes stop_codon:yes gene_type:complete
VKNKKPYLYLFLIYTLLCNVTFALSSLIKDANKVEIYHLNHDIFKSAIDTVKPRFEIKPYNTSTSILSKVIIYNEEAKDFINLWYGRSIDLDGNLFGSAFCHYPIVGFKFYHDDKILLQTSICFYCNNYYIDKEWKQLTANEHNIKLLKESILKLMNIPDLEKSPYEK